MLFGIVPSFTLVWAGPSHTVTGETGGRVAFSQKFGALNKPPGTHKDFIPFSLCLRAALN